MQPSRLLIAPLLVSAWVLGLGGISFYTPAMTTIQQDFGVSVSLIKLTISAFILGKAISMLIIAPFADRFSRKKTFLFGLGLFTLGSLICLLSPTIDVLLAGRFVEGLGVSICILMGRSLVNDEYPPNQAANLFSIIFIGNAIAITLLPVLAGYITTYLSWRWIFFILSVYGAGVIALIYSLLPPKKFSSDNIHLLSDFWKDAGTILRNPTFLAFMLSLSLIDTGEKILTTTVPFIFMDKLNFSHIAFGYLQGSLWVAHLAGLALCGYLVLRKPLHSMIAIGVLACLFASFALIFAVFIPSSSLFLMTIGMFIFMLSTGFIVPTSLVGIANPFPKMIGLATALAMAIEFFMGAIVTALISHIKNHDLAILTITALTVSIGIFICWFWVLRKTSQQPAQITTLPFSIQE